MSDVLKRLAELSPEKRRLLELRLQVARSEAAGGAIRPRERTGAAFPLSFSQQRLWVVDELQPGTGFYNIPFPIRMRGPLRVDALEHALDALRERHESLRTTFATGPDGPVQHVHAHLRAPLAVDDLSALAQGERGERLRALIREDANAGFDLKAGPLLRTRLVRLADDDHVLLFTMHHIVSDGWSMGVVTHELGALYAAHAEGRDAGLAPLPVQYADFAAWQREHLAGATLERHLSYWRERLAGVPPTLDLPTDRPRPAEESHRGGTCHFELPPVLGERLRTLARAEGTTLFAVLLAGLRTVLGRHAGQDDFVIGSPVANRTRAEVEGLVGFFVNTLALRTDLGGDPTFRELLRRERETTLGAYQHQDLPFERLVEELRLERDLSRNPLFQVAFVLQNAPAEALRLAGLAIEHEPFDYAAAKFDLTVSMVEAEGGGIAASAEYAADLFDAATVERLTAHLRLLLADAAARPDLPISRLSLAGDEERARVESFEGEAAEYPRDAGVAALFAEQARRTPDAVALTSAGEALGYAELEARANRLARHLAAQGVRRGTRVGLSLERSPELVVALLAVLKAGAAYVPLDPGYPADRLAYMVGDAGVTHLLVRSAVPAPLAAFHGRVLRLDEAAAAVAAQSPEAFDAGAGGEDVCYVIYTSGSTGTPKGVAAPHRAVARLVRGTGYVDFSPEQVFLLLAPIAFDASTFEVWGPLLNGARLALFPPHVPSLEELGRFVEEQGITTLWLTTGLFHQMVDSQVHRLRGVRQLLTGGDVVSVAHVRRALEALPGTMLVNAYGPTESTTFASRRIVGAGDVERTAVPIGTPIANTRIRVLDEGLRPAALGVPGELWIGGDGLAHGYLNKPGMTAERFVPDPFSLVPGARLYRSGDRARWLADGSLEFLGRADQQVKIRGFRIELGEIESAVCQHPAVREVCVVVREDVPGDKRLAAYVVPADGTLGDARAELRPFLQQRLPEYMVPAMYVVMEALPLNQSGKVDRRALPVPEGVVTAESRAPRTPTEEVLAGLWAEVLGVERVGVEDNFFELGGHSLLGTRVVSRIRTVFGAELPLRVIFEAPRVRELAERIDQARADGAEPVPPVVPAERSGPLPLSFAQERLWFLDQMEPGGSAYNMPFVIELKGTLDVAALDGALGDVVRRHEALRTTFDEVDASPVQRVAPPGGFALEVRSLEALPEGERAAELERLASGEAQRPFDLGRGPLFRATLLRVADERHVLLLTMHHIVSDGWSMGVLFNELSALYAARLEHREPELPPVPVQYGDFAVWQRRHLQGERQEQQVRYWRNRLAGAPAVLELPTDRPRPPAQSFRGDTYRFVLPADLSAAVGALTRREGATAFMTLLAAFQALLSRYARQDDVVVGTPIAGRTRAEVEGLIGFFVNTLVLRADLSADPTFRELLAQVRESTLAAYAHQDLPFERLVEELHVERSLAYTPLFQVMFVVQNAEGGLPGLPGVEVAASEVRRGTSKFDLTFSMEERAGRLAGTLEYSTDLFDAATIHQLARHFEVLLRGLVGEPDRRVSTVELLPEDEEQRVLHGWNRSSRRDHYRRDLTLHGMFEAQVRATPGAPALSCGDVTLTYAELNERANRLAGYLRSRGVGPEVRVGILMERTEELIVAMYAVLKAGGAYVPLDPAYPAERVAFMLRDTRVPVLLTQERLVDRLPETAAEVLPVDSDWDRIAAFPAADPAPRALPENLAYLIYTSGSTGTPKGIQLEHRTAAVVVQWMRDEFADDLRRSVLAATSVCFDVSIAEIFGTLSWGGRIVLVKNALSLASLPPGQEVVMASMVPSAAHELLRMKAIPATLRSINLGGEPVKPALSNELHATGTIEQVVNLYGPSEDTTYTTALWIPAGIPRMTVGRPVANTQIYILDRHFRPCAAGVAGELYIGGHGVTRGYHDRPGMTAEKYLPDPFGGQPGGRMYRTGDLARWLPDGEIEYLGRLDHQVKIRGHRVEVGEVEATLATHAGLEESTVVVREDGGLARLVAYYVPGAGAPTVAALRAHVRERLPEYMVPSAWVRLPALPHTPNGKVDKRALPAPEVQGGDEDAYVAPRTPSEQVLAALWAEVLDLERVGLRDNFFELGGHSLLATRVMSRLRGALQVELPLRVLFDAPTVEELAERVDAARGQAQGLGGTALVPVPRDGELPLSFAQERLWFVESLQRGLPVYNMPMLVRLRGPLDVEALRRALEEVVGRHEPLRTTFTRRDGRPVQVIHPAGRFDLPLRDLSALAGDAAAAETGRLAEEEAQLAFDLETGPLFRAGLLRVSADEHVLLVTMHHIVSDGWSMGVFFREMEGAYEAFLAGRPSPLEPLPVQYADFAAWQRGWLRGDTVDRQLAYWGDKLRGAPALDLPTDRARPAVQSYRGARHFFRIPPELKADLAALSRRQGGTLFMTLLAAFKVLLWRYAGQEDVVVGSPIAGRSRSELEGLIGFFVNTVALRTDLSGDPTFEELLARVRETTLDAYAHQDLPFERLVEELQPERSLSRHPIFQVTFSIQSADMGADAVGALRIVPEEGETQTTKFDITVGLFEHEDGLSGGMEYATDLFDAPTIARLADEYRLLLAGVAADPARRLSDLPRLLEDAERHSVLVEWNQTAREHAAGGVHEWIAARAAELPGAAAVVRGDDVVTRGELDAAAAELARRLGELGVRAESRVGVLAGETAERTIAALAVLRAGAACVPLDPDAPAGRLAEIVGGLRVIAVVADEAHAARAAALGVPSLVPARVAGAAAEAASPGEVRPAAMDGLAAVVPVAGRDGSVAGVMLTHRGLANLAGGSVHRFALAGGSRVVAAAPLGDDLGLRVILAALAAGAEVHLPERPGARSGAELAGWLRRARVTHAIMPTPTLSALPEGDLPELEVVVAVGRASPAGTVHRWRPQRRMVQAYGPAETASFASAVECVSDRRRPAMGRGWDNLRLYVLDEKGQPVPVGVAGELYVGGASLARGYDARPALTASRLVPDPFGNDAGGRLFRTGERARWRIDGQVELLGRVDEQVRIRGFRVEPGEIEALLAAEPGVRDALVAARDDQAGGVQLVAYVVTGGGAPPTAARLRDHLRERLPEYMVPAGFVLLEALPLGPDGRVDVGALPAPASEEEHEGYVAPQGEMERRIAAVWRELLQLARVGVHENFFEIGGHSLLLTRMHERLREALEREVSMIDLFQYPTVAALAAHLEGGAEKEAEAPRQSRDRGAARRAAAQRRR